MYGADPFDFIVKAIIAAMAVFAVLLLGTIKDEVRRSASAQDRIAAALSKMDDRDGVRDTRARLDGKVSLKLPPATADNAQDTTLVIVGTFPAGGN